MKKSIYRQQLDELYGDLEEPKKTKNKSKKGKDNDEPVAKKNILQQFNEKKAKGDLQTTLLKTVADVAGIGIGTVLSTAAGKAAPLLGIALIGGGHYIGDESGLMRAVGASAFAHSVAKAKEYREHPDQTIRDRLSNLKDEWLIAFLLKHYEQDVNGLEETESADPPPKVRNQSLETIDNPDSGNSESGNLDLPGQDECETQNYRTAQEYERHQVVATGDVFVNDGHQEPQNHAADYDWFDPDIDFNNF